MKIQTICICFGTSPTYRFLFKEKYQNLNIWWYFKVPQANCFGEDFDSFGQILVHWQ
jgi:hypothetical protein